MVTTKERHQTLEPVAIPTTRRIGYAVGVAVDVGLLWLTHHLLAWDVLPFLTSDWNLVVPIITVSVGASMIANACYLFYDATWFKSLTEIAVLGAAIAATVRLLEVFPFDFTVTAIDWTGLGRTLLVLAVAGSAIGMLAAGGRFMRSTVVRE